MKRGIFVGLILALLILSSCSRPDTAADSKAPRDIGAPVQGDWLIVRYEGEPDKLNPLLSTSTYANYAMFGANSSQIYEFLMAYDMKDWTFTKPLIASAPPEVSADHLTYTFPIREGIKWHDGQMLTPNDVLFTFKAAMCPLVDSAQYRSYLGDLTDVQIDGNKIRFIVSKPNVNNVSNLGNILAIVPKHVFDPEGLLDSVTFKDIIGPKGKTDPKIKKFADQFNGHPANRAPVGTGPYKFEKWDTGKELSMVRNDEYWGTKPYLDRVVVRFIADYTAALTALKAGEIDLVQRLQPIQYAQQTNGPAFDQQFTKAKYSLPGVFYIVWNNERPFLKDKRVRQALTMLVDRQKIIETLRFGLGKIATGPLNPNSYDYNPNINPWPYDPKRAAQLLDEAGWTDHDGDGIRDKDGVKFKFEFLGGTGSTIFTQLSPVLRDAFQKAGIEMTERIVEFNVMSENLKDHKFDAASIGTTSDLVQDPYQIWHSSAAQNRGSNWSSFKNAESDHLLEQARLEFDPEKRKELYWKWQEIIHDEQPYTFLYDLEDPAAYSKRFQNVQWIPLRPGYDLNTWWVAKSQQKYGKTAAP